MCANSTQTAQEPWGLHQCAEAPCGRHHQSVHAGQGKCTVCMNCGRATPVCTPACSKAPKCQNDVRAALLCTPAEDEAPMCQNSMHHVHIQRAAQVCTPSKGANAPKCASDTGTAPMCKSAVGKALCACGTQLCTKHPTVHEAPNCARERAGQHF